VTVTDRQAESKKILLPFAGEPRVHRYVFFTEDEVKMRELLATELSVWTHVILETGL
jgi:hypothetical protein